MSAFKEQGLLKKLLGEKKQFIHNLQATYPVGVYQARQFFGVLYELTQSDKYTIACDWLRGEFIDQEDLKTLGVNFVIDSEDAARGILGNFGRIADATKPIVLCFDQIELAPKLADDSRDISAVFNVNTAFHNNVIKNFLVVLSIVTDCWRQAQDKKTIPLSDLSRIQEKLTLKQITLEQVEALWTSRLSPLHSQASPKPESSIAPLDKQELEKKYPGGKANLRESLNLGGRLFQEYKSKLIDIPNSNDNNGKISPSIEPLSNPLAAFQLIWQDEFNTNKKTVDKIRQFSEQELIDMLQKAMQVLQVKGIKQKLLPSPTYASYSFSYSTSNGKKQGILWHEEPNMRAFGFAMRACERAIQANQCDSLILIRAEKFINTKTQAYNLYQRIFHASPNRHIAPSLEDVHFLRTYQKLANEALSGDLVINYEVTDLKTLEKLVRESKVLEECKLLQNLGILSNKPSGDPEPHLKVKEYLLNLMQNQYILGKLALIDNVTAKFTEVNHHQVEEIINELWQKEKSITILNPNSQEEEKIVCLVPQG